MRERPGRRELVKRGIRQHPGHFLGFEIQTHKGRKLPNGLHYRIKDGSHNSKRKKQPERPCQASKGVSLKERGRVWWRTTDQR